MVPTIHGRIMIQFPIVTQHHRFSRKFKRKNVVIQKGVLQNFSRFNRSMKHFKIDLAMKNIMSTYEQ